MKLERKSSFRVEHARVSRSPSPFRPYFRRLRRTRALFCILIISFYFLKQALVRIHGARLKAEEPDFSGLIPANFSWLEFVPDQIIRTRLPDGDFDRRYNFIRKLGSGYEGHTAVHRDVETSTEVVIKTFDIGSRSSIPQQLRNIISGVVSYWPSEIPATLLLAGKLASSAYDVQEYLNSSSAEYLPAIDYFLTASPRPLHRGYRFHLVTPYLSLGTLSSLGTYFRSSDADISRTTSDVDQILRPSFLHLLSAIAQLHARGYCHNDIKPSNILALSPTRWILGDLGAVREITHPYYSAELWARKNQWRDCRQNDIRRLLKSYLELLRAATADRETWDVHFYAGREPWARMYWDYIRRPIYAAEFLDTLQLHSNTNGSAHHSHEKVSDLPHPLPLTQMLNSRLAALNPEERHKILAIAVRNELQCTSLRYGWRDWWMAGAWKPYLLLERNENHNATDIG